MAKKKEKIIPFFKYLVYAMVIITMITLILFKFIDILPNEYFLVLLALLSIITTFISLLILTRKGKKRKIIGTLLSIGYLVILILLIIYELNTLGFLKKLGFKNYKTENYSVLVLKNSNYEELTDLEKKTFGSLKNNTAGLKKAKDKILTKISVNFLEYDDVNSLKNSFLNQKEEAMLIENSILAILIEVDNLFANSYDVIYEFSFDVVTDDITKDVNIREDAFNIYVSGIDTYGVVSSVSRSDVNMIISVNPKTKKILITSIPRDYYIDLVGKNGKDKLTHAGIYGVDTSVKSLEKLLDTKINYYVKVNFSSVIKVVDALNGVDVYSKYAFTSIDGYKYQSGYNYLNGEEALSFVRERQAFTLGDRVRVENQANLIKALIAKATSPTIITKYNDLLLALSDLFITNLDNEDITEFIKMQIEDKSLWHVDNYSLNGIDGYDYTISYSGTKLYVMYPNEETVINAQYKIKNLLNE